MYWLIVGRDKPRSIKLRESQRAAHVAYAWRRDLAARALIGAPLTKKDDGSDMAGTVMIVEAPTRKAIEAFVQNDPYTLSGLFEKVEITPMWSRFEPQAQFSRLAEPWSPPK